MHSHISTHLNKKETMGIGAKQASQHTFHYGPAYGQQTATTVINNKSVVELCGCPGHSSLFPRLSRFIRPIRIFQTVRAAWSSSHHHKLPVSNSHRLQTADGFELTLLQSDGNAQSFSSPQHFDCTLLSAGMDAV